MSYKYTNNKIMILILKQADDVRTAAYNLQNNIRCTLPMISTASWRRNLGIVQVCLLSKKRKKRGLLCIVVGSILL